MPEPTIEEQIKQLEYEIKMDWCLCGTKEWHLVEDRYRENCKLLAELKDLHGDTK